MHAVRGLSKPAVQLSETKDSVNSRRVPASLLPLPWVNVVPQQIARMRARNSPNGDPREVWIRLCCHVSPNLHATSTSRSAWSSAASTDLACGKVWRLPRDILRCEMQTLLYEQSTSQCPVREAESRIATSQCCVCTIGHSVLAPLLPLPGASKRRRIASSGLGIIFSLRCHIAFIRAFVGSL